MNRPLRPETFRVRSRRCARAVPLAPSATRFTTPTATPSLCLNAIATVLLAAVGCRCSDGREPLLVFAASSLTESFQDLEAIYEAEHPDVDVSLSFAGSQALRVQIEQGAEADVFASAAPVHMDALVAAGLAEPSTVFASNELVVAVPIGGAGAVSAFEELPDARRIVLGACAGRS